MQRKDIYIYRKDFHAICKEHAVIHICIGWISMHNEKSLQLVKKKIVPHELYIYSSKKKKSQSMNGVHGVRSVLDGPWLKKLYFENSPCLFLANKKNNIHLN